MRTISFRKRNQNHLTDKIFENNVLPSQTLSKTTPAIQPTSPSSYNVKRFKRYAKVLVLSMILSVNWIFLIPCEYEVDCLRNEAMAWGNIAHKSSVLVSMIQMQHPEQKVDLPWFIHWKFYKDKLFWNMLIQCDIQFTISRFNIIHSERVDPTKDMSTLSFPLSKCMLATNETNPQHDLVFIGRGKAHKRHMENESKFATELQHRLQKYDMLVTYIKDMSDFSLYLQAQTYRDAKFVLSMHGSQQSFSMFSVPDATMIEMIPCYSNRCSKWPTRNISPIRNWNYVKVYGTKAKTAIRYPRDMIAKWNNDTLDQIEDILLNSSNTSNRTFLNGQNITKK